MSINRDYSQDKPPDRQYLQWYVWIDVNARLPDHSRAVLVHFLGDYALGYWSLDDEEWTIEGNALGFDPVRHLTHWCELPKPPEA